MLHAFRASRLTPIWVLFATLLIVGFAASRMAPSSTQGPTGLVAAYVDLNGNGIDDTCETEEVLADAAAVAASDAEVDLNGDGTISVSEAAQSDRIGGPQCNHGGYVSWVAHGSCPDPTPTPEAPALVTGPAPEDATDEATTESTGCDQATDEPTDEASTDEAADDTTTDSVCVEVPPPDRDPALDEQKNGHGKWVSSVAKSDAIGGKNCNHGGAVSEAAKKDHEAAAAARAAAKAEREAARAEKQAAKDAARAARDAAKAAREHGKGKSKNH